MSAESDFRALLAGFAGLTALVSTRIAQNSVPQGSAVPLVVFTATHAPEYGLDNTLLADQVSFSVQCWGVNAIDSAAVAAQVRAAVATNADYLIVSESTAFDAELDLDAVELTVERWIT